MPSIVNSFIGALYSEEWGTSDEVWLFGACLVGCLYMYTMLSLFKLGNKSWYLTLYSSSVTTVFGLYFGYRCMQDGIIKVAVEEQQLARCIAIFFISYCVMDLIIGWFEYEQEIDYTDGWCHHMFYIFLLLWLLHNNMTTWFAIAMIEELPTVVLGCWRVRNKTAKDELPAAFGVAFFVTRIGFHLALTYRAWQISAVGFTCCMLLLNQHIKWFHKWAVGHLRNSGNGGIGNGGYISGGMSLTTKLSILAGLITLQIVGHGYVAFRLSTKYNFGSVTAIIVHMITFCYFTIKLVMVLQDAYSENFIMDAISKRKVIYNISWEDPAIDHDCMKTGPGDIVLTISSAGCNPLDYMVQGCDTVVAADLNEAQLATLELKIAGLKELTHAEFFAIWGESDFDVFNKVYKSKLRSHLTPESKSFWDENGILIKDNFMFAGTSGLMAYIMSFPARFFGIKAHMEALTGECPTGLGTTITLWLTRAILSRYWIWSWLAPLGGVPLSQLQLIERDPQVFCERILQIVSRDMWTKDNYFYYGYIVGKFSKECCPRYLEEKNFAYCKANAHRVIPFRGTWAEAAQTRDDFTVYSLLDSMDWMPPQMVAENIGMIIPRMNRDKGRIFWRSFAPKVHSPILEALKPRLVPDVDRVGWYMTQYVVDKIPANYDSTKLLTPMVDSAIRGSVLGDFKVMAIMALYGAFKREKDSTEFYKRQGKEYDGFREALLPDRDVLLRYAVPWTSSPKTWVSVGCGTARDIEYVVQHIIRTNTQVYLVDLSPALLEVARARVAKLGLEKHCHLIEGDINSKEILAKLPKQGSVDLVTCSYCLTMIPPWKEALTSMLKLLRKGGHMALVDFTARENQATSLKQRFYKWWFANDGVWLNEEQPKWLKENLTTTWYEEAESKAPYVPIWPTHYVFCGEKK